MTSAGSGERDWYTRAGVRRDPRRLLRDELGAGQLYFPPDLIPYAGHPLVLALPEPAREALAARHLFQYLGFTTHFETEVVNRATQRIATGRSGVDTPAETRLDAFRIYCDEGYHALYSFDVIRQIADASGVEPVPYDFAPFRERLDAVGVEALPGQPVLAQLLQVVVFETLVTAILNDVPKDPRVLTVVRRIVRDHARDEGWHHAFFARFFQELWARQSPAERVRVARCLPGLVRSSLLPDLRPVRAALTVAGLGAAQVEEVVRDSYPRAATERAMREAARHALRLFEETGVLAVDGARDAFLTAGLLTESEGDGP
ncbi:diiron oxygenase [Streptomyces cinerochromogenes]|uniref:diiron oxygenase n=1 Tax=Streptomyces cinerochromogenes TaxID=66422 RepID=UPI00367FAEB9